MSVLIGNVNATVDWDEDALSGIKTGYTG